jgi:predicted lactoylglutathione lyase
MSTKIFVNLPVKDLEKTKEFFSKLGFTFNPMFTDENTACMVISEENYAMLLTEKFFQNFIRAKVDEIVTKAVAAGGSEYREKQDYGWMYGRAFKDIDGHIWEAFYADLNAMPEEMKNKK